MIENTTPELEALLAGKSVSASKSLVDKWMELGIPLVAKGSKVQLAERLEILDPRAIRDACRSLLGEEAETELMVYRTIGSTNDEVFKRLGTSGSHYRLCLSESQSAGKGRRGRNWVSPFGKNIYFTLGAFLQTPIASLGGLSLITGMQVVDVLRSFGVDDIGLKWPNDVLRQGGKMAGILVELKPAEARGNGVVIGVGINLALSTEDSTLIDQAWAATGHGQLGRNELAGRLAASLISALRLFEEVGFKPFSDCWPDYNLNAGKTVRILRGEERFEGVDEGIDTNGNLLLRTESGLEVHNSGEVSLRPL